MRDSQMARPTEPPRERTDIMRPLATELELSGGQPINEIIRKCELT